MTENLSTDHLIDDDPSLIKMNRRFNDHVRIVSTRFGQLRDVIQHNTSTVESLDARFELHDVQEIEFRDDITNMVQGWVNVTHDLAHGIKELGEETRELRKDIAKQQLIITPIQNGLNWFQVTKVILAWLSAVGAGIMTAVGLIVFILKLSGPSIIGLITPLLGK